MTTKLEDYYEMDIIYDIITNFTGETNKSKVRFCVLLAHSSIRNYLNALDEDMLDLDKGYAKYEPEVIQMAMYLLEKTTQGNVASKQQGERAISYHNTIEIPSHIKDMLPPPFVRSL